MNADSMPFQRPVQVAGLGNVPKVITGALDELERARLAADGEIPAVKAFHYNVRLTSTAAGILAAFEIRADVTQTCVVTADPVQNRVFESFELRYIPEGRRPKILENAKDVVLDLDEEDPPEYFSGDAIDLAPALIDYFLLGLDPYPKCPGAEIAEKYSDGAAEETRPFSVLSIFKPKS